MVSYHTHTHLIINELHYFLVGNCDKDLTVPGRVTHKDERQRYEPLLHGSVPATEEFPGTKHERLTPHDR